MLLHEQSGNSNCTHFTGSLGEGCERMPAGVWTGACPRSEGWDAEAWVAAPIPSGQRRDSDGARHTAGAQQGRQAERRIPKGYLELEGAEEAREKGLRDMTSEVGLKAWGRRRCCTEPHQPCFL